jgi:hypothetical protein
MAEDKKSVSERHREHRDDNWAMTNWRSWGSWFSWGSPVGLGLFFVLVSIAVWILFHVGK